MMDIFLLGPMKVIANLTFYAQLKAILLPVGFIIKVLVVSVEN